MNLNAAQEEAVRHVNGPALVLAGPGSGKTAVITERTRKLIAEHKIPAGNILVVTFSRKAAQSMKDRFLLMHKDTAVPYFGTFHSIFFMILKKAYGISGKNIISEEKKTSFLREEIDRLGMEAEESEDFYDGILNGISCIKSGSASIESYRPDGISAKNFRAIFTGYSRALSNSGLIDFDDMLSLCLTLLRERPDILSYWQSRFTYILIDEFQDINPIQYEIIRLLAHPQNNLFVVGDDDQSIYAFRGARPAIMKQFLKDFPRAARITLDKNYRCHPKIQRASLSVIEENRTRFAKNLKSAVRPSSYGSFRICRFADPQSEYHYLADQILAKLSEGIPAEEIAVLVRSSLQLPLLSQILSERQVPVDEFTPPENPFRNFIGEDIASYLRLADSFSTDAFDQDQFQTDFFRIINRPSRYITRTALEQAFVSGAASSEAVLDFLSNFYRNNSEKRRAVRKMAEDLRMLRKCPPYAAVKYLRSAVGYEAFLISRAGQYRKTPQEYLEMYERIEDALKDGYSMEKEAPAKQAAPKTTEADTSECSHVRLLTMHASKGLEFTCVFLPDLNEDILPSRQAKTTSQIEEERRVFYVAMTRAACVLEVYFCEKIRNKKAVPSRFLNCFLNN